nr:CDP-diacylglycerol--glycerol-3-phosphate 3-phosphatidyltransferase [Parascardovia denticolens]
MVTFTRIALVIVFIVLTALAGPFGQKSYALRWVGALLFIFAASTDKIDGYLARKYDQVTELGKLMDPIADKLLICSALVLLSVFGELWWWVTILFLIRELGITVMRFFIIDQGGSVIAANMAGKLKTVFECVGLSLLLAPVWSWAATGLKAGWVKAYLIIALIVTLVALALCLYSGFMYVYGVMSAGKKKQA